MPRSLRKTRREKVGPTSGCQQRVEHQQRNDRQKKIFGTIGTGIESTLSWNIETIAKGVCQISRWSYFASNLPPCPGLYTPRDSSGLPCFPPQATRPLSPSSQHDACPISSDNTRQRSLDRVEEDIHHHTLHLIPVRCSSSWVDGGLWRLASRTCKVIRRAALTEWLWRARLKPLARFDANITTPKPANQTRLQQLTSPSEHSDP